MVVLVREIINGMDMFPVNLIQVHSQSDFSRVSVECHQRHLCAIAAKKYPDVALVAMVNAENRIRKKRSINL